MKTRVEIQGIAEVRRALSQLPDELKKRGGSAIRAAMRAGAAIVAEAMKANVRMITNAPNKDGENVSTGLLEESIAVRRVKMRNNAPGEAYVAGPRNVTYPNGVRAQAVGAMLEYGSEKRPPMPWAEPAFNTVRQAAADEIVQVARERLTKMLDVWQRKQARAARRAARAARAT